MSKLWTQVPSGYMASTELSKYMRFAVKPICRFRQFSDIEHAKGKKAGDTFAWTVFGKTKDKGNKLAENVEIPTTTFPEDQAQVKIAEYGIAVPYSGFYDDHSEFDVQVIIQKQLKDNAADTIDLLAYEQFNNAILSANTTSATGINIAQSINYAGASTDNLTTDHVKALVDYAREDMKIPVYDGQNYILLSTVRQLRPFKNELETIKVYTSEGWGMIMDGEIGKYEDVRCVEQTNIIPATGMSAQDQTGSGTFFFGADTVTEVWSQPLQLRGKLPGDYGRSKAIAWYYCGAFGITHGNNADANTRSHARIIKVRAK